MQEYIARGMQSSAERVVGKTEKDIKEEKAYLQSLSLCECACDRRAWSRHSNGLIEVMGEETCRPAVAGGAGGKIPTGSTGGHGRRGIRVVGMDVRDDDGRNASWASARR